MRHVHPALHIAALYVAALHIAALHIAARAHTALERLTAAGHTGKGSCLDSAVIESFFGDIKGELLYLQEAEPLKRFKAEGVDCFAFCNNCRRKAKRKGLLPAIHGQQALLAASSVDWSHFLGALLILAFFAA